jgi:L,D-transpeptidase catalytic domain
MSRAVGRVLLALLACALLPRAANATTPCDVRYPSDSTVAWDCRVVGPGESLESLFGADWPAIARFNRMDRRHAWPGARIRVPRDLADLAAFRPLPGRYAPAESSARFILVDLGEQFLGAYEAGRLVLSFPVATGRASHETPAGDFRIDLADPRHVSSLYTMEGTRTPYPMNWALRFLRTRGGVSFWIHGRDLPGVPASHGCVGLVDEPMQRRYYGQPADPRVEDARMLFEWAVGPAANDGTRTLDPGLPVRILGRAPRLRGGDPAPVGSRIARSNPGP